MWLAARIFACLPGMISVDLSQNEILAAALDNATWISNGDTPLGNCKHFGSLLSSWLRQWIER